MNKICERRDCTGCYACFNICPKHAIAMIEDEYGRVYPIIDEEKCINCGLCKRICPQLNSVEFYEPKTAYAMYNKDADIRKASTSGGAATTFYSAILDKGGVIYGANNIEKGKFKFIRITKKSDLYKVKGSKYVHCYIENTFSQAKEDLNNNRRVLFIGTPCQIAGLKMYLKKDYENLITVDLICHGVPTQQLLKDEISLHVKNINKVTKVTFREKDFSFRLYEDDKLVYDEKNDTNYYYYRFSNAMFYRENCYECKYAKRQRVSDITIGDFWGLKSQNKNFKDESKGISLVMPNTTKGDVFLKECLGCMSYEEHSVDEAVIGNHQLIHPTKKHKDYDKFMKLYKKNGYEKACRKTRTFKQILKSIKVVNDTYYKIKRKLK